MHLNCYTYMIAPHGNEQSHLCLVQLLVEVQDSAPCHQRPRRALTSTYDQPSAAEMYSKLRKQDRTEHRRAGLLFAHMCMVLWKLPGLASLKSGAELSIASVGRLECPYQSGHCTLNHRVQYMLCRELPFSMSLCSTVTCWYLASSRRMRSMSSRRPSPSCASIATFRIVSTTQHFADE